MNSDFKILKNTTYLSIGKITMLVLGMIWMAFFARYIGPEGIGRVSFAQSILVIIAIFIEFGLQNLIIRSVTQDRSCAGKYFISMLLIKLILSLIVYGTFFVYLHFWGWESLQNKIMVIVALTVLVQSFILATNAILYAYEKMELDASGQVMRSVLALSAGLVAIHFNFGLINILIVLLCTSFLRLLWNLWFLLRMDDFSLRYDGPLLDWNFIYGIFKKSLLFAVLSMIAVVNSNIILIVLKIYVDITQIGYFFAAQRIYIVLFIFPSMLNIAILPNLSSSFIESKYKMANTFLKAYRYLFIIALPMSIGMILISKSIVLLIFGEKFIESVGPLKILALALINSLGYVNSSALIAIGKEKFLTLTFGIGLVILVISAIIIFPMAGVLGACWVVSIINIGGFIFYSFVIFRCLQLKYPFVMVGKVILASISMGIFVHLLLPYINFLFLSLLLAPALYLGLIIIFKVLDGRDYHSFIKLLHFLRTAR